MDPLAAAATQPPVPSQQDRTQEQLRRIETARPAAWKHDDTNENAAAREAFLRQKFRPQTGQTRRGPPPAYEAQQQVVLVNVAHVEQRPRAQRPAVRILGAFPTRDHAVQHARQHLVHAMDDANILDVGLNQTFLVCTSLDKQQHATYARDKWQRLEAWYAARAQKNADTFAHNVAHQTAGETGQSLDALRQSGAPGLRRSRRLALRSRKRKFPAEPHGGGGGGAGPCRRGAKKQKHVAKQQQRAFEGLAAHEAKSVPRAAEVRNQAFAVVSLLPDMLDLDQPEPGVCVHGLFPAEHVAREHLKTHVAPYVVDRDLFVVDCYEWLRIEDDSRSDQIPREFRDEKQDEIIQAKSRGARRADAFKDWCKRENYDEVPVVEVGPPTADQRLKTALTKRGATFHAPRPQERPTVMEAFDHMNRPLPVHDHAGATTATNEREDDDQNSTKPPGLGMSMDVFDD